MILFVRYGYRPHGSYYGGGYNQYGGGYGGGYGKLVKNKLPEFYWLTEINRIA